MSRVEDYAELDRHLVPDADAKREFVDEMLDTLPGKLWSDPKLTLLDPACGIGNFPIAIYF
ncbi:MAG: hypothetical protein P4L81_03500 [Candidatus Pacebacteria bacterium]|nr:hypothetical protein [Candidatus Paceibacterota bacterium]